MNEHKHIQNAKNKLRTALSRIDEVYPTCPSPARDILSNVGMSIDLAIDDLEAAESKPDLGMREKLAELAHEQWSGWMKYLFKQCTHPHGLCVIPDWAEEGWQRQMNTAYHDLSQEEKDSDRTEADKFLAVLQAESKRKQGKSKLIYDKEIRSLAVVCPTCNKRLGIAFKHFGSAKYHCKECERLESQAEQLAAKDADYETLQRMYVGVRRELADLKEERYG